MVWNVSQERENTNNILHPSRSSLSSRSIACFRWDDLRIRITNKKPKALSAIWPKKKKNLTQHVGYLAMWGSHLFLLYIFNREWHFDLQNIDIIFNLLPSSRSSFIPLPQLLLLLQDDILGDKPQRETPWSRTRKACSAFNYFFGCMVSFVTWVKGIVQRVPYQGGHLSFCIACAHLHTFFIPHFPLQARRFLSRSHPPFWAVGFTLFFTFLRTSIRTMRKL